MKLATLGLIGISGVATLAGRVSSANSVVARAAEADAFQTHTIDQLIDHFPHSGRYAPHDAGTFKQRYFFEDKYYKPGGPVFLYIGGEVNAKYRFSNLQTGLIKILMEATNGLGVILENRYYGASFPYNTSTTDELRFFTTEQTIADNAYFAQHAIFPGVNSSRLNAPQTPWILYGGSLAGAQTAFSLKQYGGDDGVLWAGIAASGTTKAEYTYPQWYDPIQKFGPQDCVGRINGIVDNIDMIFASGDEAAIHKMKALFGFEALKDNRDFAYTIAFPLGGPMNYPTNTWQELNWYFNPGAEDFWDFCSNVTNLDAPENVTSIDYALSSFTHGEPWPGLGNYAEYVKRVILPIYGPDCMGDDLNSTDCFGTQNETFWADTANLGASGSRSYLYSACTEAGLYQTARLQGPTLLSRVIQEDFTQQWCTWAFPPGKYNRIPARPDIWRINNYGGFSVTQDRLAHIDGGQDVWGDLCYHSERAPKRRTPTAREAELHPQLLITGAGHHWDSLGNGPVEQEPQFIREAHKWEIRTVKRWLREFNEKNKGQ